MKQLVTNILLCLLILILSYFLISSFLQKDVETMSMNNYGDSSAPVVMTNTWIDISKNGMEKRSYISDTCGNFSKSTYDMVIHSSPFSIFGASSSGVTVDSCLPYQVFVPNSDGGKYGQCQNQCAGNQYFDLTTKSCMLCPIGYINDGNNQCVPLETCPRGFKYTDHSGNCNSCPSGKKYDEGIHCIDICLEPYKELGADGHCNMKCPSRNEKWDANTNDGSGGCLPCGIGMVDNGRNQCIALPPCPEGMHFNSDSKCVSQCQDYERYIPLANQCQKICSPTQKFDKNTGLCVDCPTGFQSNVDDAYSCKAIPVPEVTCGPGYTLVGGFCKSICPDDKKNSLLDPTSCVPKCPPDSIYNTSNTDCTYCPYGNPVNNVCPSPPAITTPPANKDLVKGVYYDQCSAWTYRDKSGKCTPYCDENYTYMNGTCKLCGNGYHANDKNQCQKICPAWQINSDTDNEVCLNRCLNMNEYWNTTTSTCVPCGSDYIGVDSNNTCILKTMDISVDSINIGGAGATRRLDTMIQSNNIYDDDLYTPFKVSITFKLNGGPSFDYIDISMNNSLMGNNSVNTTEKKLNGGLITTDVLSLTVGINYAFILHFKDSAGNEIRDPLTKYVKIKSDRQNLIRSTSLPLPDYSFYYDAMLCGKVVENGRGWIAPTKKISGNLLGKLFTGLKIQSTIGANGSNTTLTIPSTALASSSDNAITSLLSSPGESGGIQYIIFYAEIGSNLDTLRQVFGNNGTVSCSTYCAGTGGASWNNELSSWSGAKCVASGINNTDPCNLVGADGADPYDPNRRICLCEKSAGPWVGKVSGTTPAPPAPPAPTTPAPTTPAPARSSTISTVKGCYGAHTPEYGCVNWSGCGYTCVGDYCAYSGTISDCKCSCGVCAAFYPDLYFDSATGKCVDDSGKPASGSPGSGTKIP